ncbi:hypothetical protein N9C31_00080 [Gammaproteobacteria bacterium]|nr:hypothetical protein [Gammaproteobacteria bacterium]
MSALLWGVMVVHVKAHQSRTPPQGLDPISTCPDSLVVDERVHDGLYQHVVFHIPSTQITRCLKNTFNRNLTYAYFAKHESSWEVHLARDFILRPPGGKKRPYRYSDLSRTGVSERKKSAS